MTELFDSDNCTGIAIVILEKWSSFRIWGAPISFSLTFQCLNPPVYCFHKVRRLILIVLCRSPLFIRSQFLIKFLHFIFFHEKKEKIIRAKKSYVTFERCSNQFSDCLHLTKIYTYQKITFIIYEILGTGFLNPEI